MGNAGSARAGGWRIDRLLVWAVLVVGALLLPACRREPSYSQATPDDVLQSAQRMAKNGRADRLTDLIYADNDDMRGLYKRLGVLLGSVQKLAVTLNEKFPKEVAELRAKAEQAAKEGKASSLMSRLGGEARRSAQRAAQRAARGGQQNSGDAMNTTLKQLLTDPYGWLDENSSKLTSSPVNDELVAVLWDGKPIMPPLGLVMKKSGDKWYIVLPTNLPVVSGFMPKTKDEFSIWGSLIRTFDNAVVELNKDVKTGKIRSVEGVAREAGEKAFVPVAFGLIAYNQAMEARKKETRRAEAAKKEAAKAAGASKPDGAAAKPKSGDAKSPEAKPENPKPEGSKPAGGG